MQTPFRGEVRNDELGVTFHFDDEGRLHSEPHMGPAVKHDTGTEEWWDHGRRTTYVDRMRHCYSDAKGQSECIPSVRAVPHLAFPTWVGGVPPQYRNGTPSFGVLMYTNRTAGIYPFHPFDGFTGGDVCGSNRCLWSAEGMLRDVIKTVRFCGMKTQVDAFERKLVKWQIDFDSVRAECEAKGWIYATGRELDGKVLGWDPRHGVRHCPEVESALEDRAIAEFAKYPRAADGFTVIT